MSLLSSTPTPTSIEPSFRKESFSKTFINSADLNLLYNYGKDIHKNYLIFELFSEHFVFCVVLVDKILNDKSSTIGDLIETLKHKLGEEYKHVYYLKGDQSRYFLEDHRNKDMDLAQFAFLNLNPSHSFHTDSDNKIYRLSLDKNYRTPLGPIVLSPARTPGESIGPL